MCLAIPMKIQSVHGAFAEVEAGGLVRSVNVQMLPYPRPGEYVLVHAGFAIKKIDPEKAQETLRLLDEIR